MGAIGGYAIGGGRIQSAGIQKTRLCASRHHKQQQRTQSGQSFHLFKPKHQRKTYFAKRYAPPFSLERWNAGRACIRVSQAPRFEYGPSLLNTLAISPTKLIWISAPVSALPMKNSLPLSAPSTYPRGWGLSRRGGG